MIFYSLQIRSQRKDYTLPYPPPHLSKYEVGRGQNSRSKQVKILAEICEIHLHISVDCSYLPVWETARIIILHSNYLMCHNIIPLFRSILAKNARYRGTIV
jgi:hypothetical protein